MTNVSKVIMTPPIKAKVNKTKAKDETSKTAKTKPKKKTDARPSDQIILGVMAKLYKRGNKAPEKKKVEAMNRLNHKTFANCITKLKKQGLLDDAEGDSFQLTENGIAETSSMTIVEITNKDVHKQLKKGLKPNAIRLFDLQLDG